MLLLLHRSPSTPVSRRLISRTPSWSKLEASSWPPKQPMDRPSPQGQQQHTTSWFVEAIHRARSFGGDATVLADYAITTTTTDLYSAILCTSLCTFCIHISLCWCYCYYHYTSPKIFADYKNTISVLILLILLLFGRINQQLSMTVCSHTCAYVSVTEQYNLVPETKIWR